MSIEHIELPRPSGRSAILDRLESRIFEAAALVILVIAGFMLRYLDIPVYQVIAADGPSYISIAKEILTSHTAHGSIHYPPFYPFLIAMASFFTSDFETAGVMVSLIMGSLLPLPVYQLGKSIFGRGAGYAAAAMTVIWPEFVFQSGNVLAYATYFTMLTTGLWLLWRAHSSRRMVPAVFSGLFMAAAYLSRQEAFISMSVICFFLAGATVLKERSVKPLKPLLTAFTVFVLFSFPYIWMVHEIMGFWTLAGKSVVTLTDCLAQYLGRFDLNRDPSFGRTSYMDLVTKYPGYFQFIIRKNFTELVRIMPDALVIFSFIGFFAGERNSSSFNIRAFFLGAFSPILVLLTIFLISSAYIAPYIPFFLILSSNGLISSEAYLAGKLGIERHGFRYVTLLAVTCYLLFSAYHEIPWGKPPSYEPAMDGGRYDQKKMGKLLKQQLPQGSKIMTRSGRIAFYSELPWVDIPQADLQTILMTAREKKVRYLIVHGELEYLRPQLAGLLLPLMSGMPGIEKYDNGAETLPGLFLKLRYTYPDSQGFVVYEFR
jgi:4-amino-4-deoxy-L-arabinose transferase-like glycosyltransferase